jgi:RNA polymerase sigma-70 factor (ECF subfamily)
MMPLSEDNELLQRYRGGDSAAFGELFQKYNKRLFGYCFTLLHDRSAADDAVQTVFLKSMESIRSLDKGELFYYWIFSIARNEIFSSLRRKRTRQMVQLDDEIWETETPAMILEQKETVAMVQQALHCLKAEYREVLVLRQFEHLSYSEIASITGDSISSVESRLFKARKALIKLLAPALQKGTLT